MITRLESALGALLTIIGVTLGLDSSCQLRPHSGSPSCRLSTKLFYYNVAARGCQIFDYRGCGGQGNANRFQSWEECMTKCTGSTNVNSFLQRNPYNPFAGKANAAQPNVNLRSPNPQSLVTANNNTQLQKIFNQKNYFESIYRQGLEKYQEFMEGFFANQQKLTGSDDGGAQSAGTVGLVLRERRAGGEGPWLRNAQLVGDGAGDGACADLVLNAVLGRRQQERYTHEYSATLGDSRHPPGSTVQLRCTENAAEATTYAYDTRNRLVDSGLTLKAVCDEKAGIWLLRGKPFKKVYCSRVAAAKSSAAVEGCRNILLYQRFSVQSQETYNYTYSETDSGSGIHPSESTVIVTCAENGTPALIYSYGEDSAFISKTSALNAVCNANTTRWMVDGKAVNQAYCTNLGNETDGDDTSCVNFNPSLFPSRRGFEFYDFKYSDTVGNRWHPENSTVFIRCTTGGLNGIVTAFDAANANVEENHVQIATCSGTKRQWMIGGSETAFARIYCRANANLGSSNLGSPGFGASNFGSSGFGSSGFGSSGFGSTNFGSSGIGGGIGGGGSLGSFGNGFGTAPTGFSSSSSGGFGSNSFGGFGSGFGQPHSGALGGSSFGRGASGRRSGNNFFGGGAGSFGNNGFGKK